MSEVKFSKSMTVMFGDTSDGHDAQFVMVLKNAAENMPHEIIRAIANEQALYVDAMRVEGGDLLISICNGSLVYAQVDNRRNPFRTDGKHRVIFPDDVGFEDEPRGFTNVKALLK
jgi:hypothetical protein